MFQPFKLLHAVRLCEAGLVSRAQDYCRQVAYHVTRGGGAARIQPDFLPDFLNQLLNLSERLKYQVAVCVIFFMVSQLKLLWRNFTRVLSSVADPG